MRVGFSSAFQEPAREMKQALEHLIAISDHKSLFDHVKSFVAARKLSDAAIATPLGFVLKIETAMRDILPAEIAVDDSCLMWPLKAFCRSPVPNTLS